MSPRDNKRAADLARAIKKYQDNKHPLPGLSSPAHLDALVLQFIDSLRRVEFANYVRDAQHSERRMQPESEFFDPLRAAVLKNRAGQNDEAWWLVFLSTHFGKHSIDGWRLVRDVYGRLGQGKVWDWNAVSQNMQQFQDWLADNEKILSGGDGIRRRFSNHRKYESLKSTSKKGTARVLESYVDWILPYKTHAELVKEVHIEVGQDPEAVFSDLYYSMSAVKRFGRLGRFDFLAMLGKLGIAPIAPGSTFLDGATGPLAGARLLLDGSTASKSKSSKMEGDLSMFGDEVGLSPQVLEDALCNWQKSPEEYIRFKG